MLLMLAVINKLSFRFINHCFFLTFNGFKLLSQIYMSYIAGWITNQAAVILDMYQLMYDYNKPPQF